MEAVEELRANLLHFIHRTFASRPAIDSCAEDIVQEAFLAISARPERLPETMNFGYLSRVCLRVAYRHFSRSGPHARVVYVAPEYLETVSAEDFVAELLKAEDAQRVLSSLETLRDVERLVVTQRYFGRLGFAELAKKHGLNLNTVLSHHRRALEKLRPILRASYGNEEEP